MEPKDEDTKLLEKWGYISPAGYQHPTANNSGVHNYLLGKYSMWGCHKPLLFFLYTSLHTPYTHYTPTPHFSGAIFGISTHIYL